MLGIKHSISVSVSRNRSGRRPCSLFNPDSSECLDIRYGNDDQKSNCSGDVQTTPRGKNLPVGRRVLDGWFLPQYRGTIRQPGNATKLCEEARYQKLSPAAPTKSVCDTKPGVSFLIPRPLAAG